MAFDFGCFISYPHDDGDLVERFVEDFVKGLKAHLMNLEKDKKYWWDREQLATGINHQQAIATGMCKSACWILIYYPKYRRSRECRKEYRAMRELEARRRQALGGILARDKAMIVPVLFSGHPKDLPGELADQVIFEDFTKYTVSGPRILEHPAFEAKIIKIAHHVWDVWKACEQVTHMPRDCHEYVLPEPREDDWGPEVEQEQPR